jgi:hypothetical protein
MVNVAPASLGKGKVEREIAQLSKEFNEDPVSVTWMAPRKGAPNAVIALWGQVRLEGVDRRALSILAAGESPHQGVLVDYVGDLYRSARNGLPVYRMIGGAGYLYSASFDDEGRGHRHYVAIDASRFSQTEIAQPESPNPSLPGNREIYAPKRFSSGAFISVETLDLIKRANIVIIGDIWSGDSERFRQVAV